MEVDIMSLFTYRRVAEGYAAHRPQYHPLIMQKIRTWLALDGQLEHALDVGCGTGLSTVALRGLVARVVGIDGSADMIAVAQARNTDDHIVYQQAAAEHLPFADAEFDLITVCGAINWIDRTRFLPEARRVLKPQGWLMIYDNTITDQMPGCSGYAQWYNKQFLARFPKPPRDETPVTASEADIHGLWLRHTEEYTNTFQWTHRQFINFILTQSNIIAAVDMGTHTLDAVRSWLTNTLAAAVPDDPATFVFGGYVWGMQRR
jgi:SAM-dependent methyltransferase